MDAKSVEKKGEYFKIITEEDSIDNDRSYYEPVCGIIHEYDE